MKKNKLLSDLRAEQEKIEKENAIILKNEIKRLKSMQIKKSTGHKIVYKKPKWKMWLHHKKEQFLYFLFKIGIYR